jgi:hypothetical protein
MMSAPNSSVPSDPASRCRISTQRITPNIAELPMRCGVPKYLEQFVSKPNQISVNNVAFTVIRDLA